MKTVILGAGISGIGAALATGGTVYEKSSVPGGLCRTRRMKEYSFDYGGGHWIFGDSTALQARYSEPVMSVKRNAGVAINKIFPYPIQSSQIDDITSRKMTMKNWLRHQFGPDLCHIFFDPFNERYTDGLYDKIIQDDVNKSPAPGKPGYNDTFIYPQLGLTDMVEVLSHGLKIVYNKEAFKIDHHAKFVIFSDGTAEPYDRLISTIPLVKTLAMIGFDASGMLPYTSVRVLNIGAERGENCPDKHWVYFPESKSGFHRVGFYSNVLPDAAPPGHAALYVEKAYYQRDEDRTRYALNVVKELKELGYIGFVHVIKEDWIEYAYTWLFNREDRDMCLKVLQNAGIQAVGRFGKWKFQGIAESFADGLAVGS
jgi:protoporphyrinogen oxidase